MPTPDLVTVSALARMLGPEWTRPLVWYWLHAARIQVSRLPNGIGYVEASRASEVLYALRQARARRRHDGHGGGAARARRLEGRY